jgi:ATP-dependent helicase/nuclease subunit A
MDAGRDEVRVMTVHGAKGLEANIVFLADTCSARSAARGGLIELAQPGRPGAAALPVWVLPGSRIVPAIRGGCDAEQQSEREEYQRLLYVAMTRARDRLYVAGFEGLQARDRGCWYDLIGEGLDGRLFEAADHAGNPVRRMECAQEAPPEHAGAAYRPEAAAPLPEWHSRAPVAAPHPVLVNPSRLDPALGGAPHAGLIGGRPRRDALLRGQLVHRLLEQLPLLPQENWARSGANFLAAEGKALSQRERKALLAEIIQILHMPDFGALFGPGSRAEIPFAAELPPFREHGPPLRIAGQIDRLIRRGGEVLILDFKSGPAIPRSPEEVPEAYLAQLAAYRLAIMKVLPAEAVRAALLWTEIPRLMAIPPALLAKGERLLYESLAARHLD